MIGEFKQETGIDLASDRMALQRLRDSAERAKVELSSVLETEINLPFITADASGPQHMVKTLSRARLEQLVSDLVDRTDGPCRQALTDSGLNASEIDEVIMVGGSSPLEIRICQRILGTRMEVNLGRMARRRLGPVAWKWNWLAPTLGVQPYMEFYGCPVFLIL